VRLSVDDAGSGFASLRHILRLEPDFIKLDRSWVHGVDTDPARQAMIAGLRHFADQTGAQLIAEGIERDEERAALITLDVDLGQGYLLGRPAPVEAGASAG
jgi:EAL domain-containing protein (putative c-di-GMP-specific phosphodiesterase class I)